MRPAEKRIFARIPFEFSVLLDIWGGHVALNLRADDLSLEGAGLTGESPFLYDLEVGDEVALRVENFEGVKAQIAWKTPARVGLQFTAPLSEVLASWVGELLACHRLRFSELMAA